MELLKIGNAFHASEREKRKALELWADRLQGIISAVPRRFERSSYVAWRRPDWVAEVVGLEVRRETGKE